MSHGTHSDWLILGQLILLQCPQANHGPAKTKQKAVLVCYNKQLIISNLEHYHWTLFWSPQKNLESRPCCQYWPHYRLFITMIRSPIKTSISVNNCYKITKSMCMLWLVNQLWLIVLVNSWKNHMSPEFEESINHSLAACDLQIINSSRVLPTSCMVYQPLE